MQIGAEPLLVGQEGAAFESPETLGTESLPTAQGKEGRGLSSQAASVRAERLSPVSQGRLGQRLSKAALLLGALGEQNHHRN